ncbi:transposase [Coleofasciculus sp. D1-CHI-01]|uniref:transposase n=1 Tax=Coleofasciculus sp. D1-CHI-01 TaxID=3068482 RepID=UPI004064C0BF
MQRNIARLNTAYKNFFDGRGFPQIFYGKTAQTIREHLPGICNYFISGTTSGVMEGINNKIRLVMRLGYGLTNFNNLRSRLLGCCS